MKHGADLLACLYTCGQTCLYQKEKERNGMELGTAHEGHLKLFHAEKCGTPENGNDNSYKPRNRRDQGRCAEMHVQLGVTTCRLAAVVYVES